MFNDLIKYIVGTAIIMGLFSFLYKKEGIEAGNRTIRVVLAVMGSLFFALFLFSVGLIIWNKDFKDYQNAILPLFIMLFVAVLCFSIALFKRDFSGQFKELSLAKNKANELRNKKSEVLLWILWITGITSFAIAWRTYNMFFFILSFLVLLAILIIRLKRGYW